MDQPLTTKNNNFWAFFNTCDLGARTISLKKTFEYLDRQPGDVVIVETGCARTTDNWTGDGCSTLLFDRYVQSRSAHSHVYSVDINADSVALCKQNVSGQVTVTASDSIVYLRQLCKTLNRKINLLYLDSYDVDWVHWQPSSAHHLKELCAIGPALTSDTLVVVDDSPAMGIVWFDQQGNMSVNSIGAGGKGRYIVEYASAIGARLEFAHYQIGYTNF